MNDELQEKLEDWSEYVILRDTNLYDDIGGLGQRIYTTAGANGVMKIRLIPCILPKNVSE